MAVPEVDWRAAVDTVLRPDISVVCEHPVQVFLTKTPALVGEVLSSSTRQRDLTYKRDIYEKLGVETYLIVDPSNSSIVLLKRQDEHFTPSDIFTIELSDDCEISPDLSGLFDDL
jgi:Uma2 family endonuclease